MKHYTCEACNAPTRTGITCTACEIARIEGLLSSEAWLAVRGSTPGDRPGHTLADTLRYELGRYRTLREAKSAVIEVPLGMLGGLPD